MEETMTEDVKLRPEEEEGLRALLRRSDALGYAHLAVSRQKWVHDDIKGEALATLEEMLAEANGHFESYKQELGISGP